MRSILFLLLLAMSARAEVIVYKGVARCALPSTTSQFSARPKVYFVVDLNSKQSYFVHYYTIAGQKGARTTFPQDNTRYVAQAITATKTIGTFTWVLDVTLGSDPGVNMLYVRGTQAPLQTSTTGGGTFVNLPKAMTGFYRQVQKVGPLSSLFEFNYTLSFDAAHTQFANNGFKNGLATVTDLQNELAAKGFQ